MKEDTEPFEEVMHSSAKTESAVSIENQIAMSDVQVQGQLDLDYLTRGDLVGKKVPLNLGQETGEQNPLRTVKKENPEKADPILKEEKAKIDKNLSDEIHQMETLIKDQVTLDNWQVDHGLKTAKRSWKLEDNKR